MSAIDRGVVEHVAKLARIALSEQEVERFTAQLAQILDAVGRLGEVDTSEIPPTASVLPLANVTREDIVRPSLPLEDVLGNAPSHDGTFFKVQAVLEERP
ncbi:MAG TPA: Asp-tRNA(Asn)/Glu-tRNA(Gln) amidotransferase subunit GatC [Candidatus Limnocylindrales bacterium]|nr:Asp-tRNA(Asn)/Glu-tRNA(Gln) amidotransferase subunit GatC [Candidatus Limnocylindrales bacterium]